MNEKLFSVKCYDTASFHVVSTAVSDIQFRVCFFIVKLVNAHKKTDKKAAEIL